MVSEIRLFTESTFLEKAQSYKTVLSLRGVVVNIEKIEKLNARFLRLNPELALCVDIDGLSLCANGMKMQPDWKAEVPRLKRASLKSEMIARACNISEKPNLIDATAGLGHDTLLMAHLGANVTLIERHPILFTLLEDSKAQAELDLFLSKVVSRIDLVFSDSTEYLKQLIADQKTVDVVYLDPMFPQRDQNQQAIKKQAQVKKQMQLLHMLLPEDGEMDLGDHLLVLAQQIAKRVVVKRPRLAVFLNDQ